MLNTTKKENNKRIAKYNNMFCVNKLRIAMCGSQEIQKGRQFSLVLIALLISLAGQSQSESIYTYEINTELGGQLEVSVPSGRVDILTETHAFEVEMASKWKEAIGQALWYGLQTDRQAGVILIKRTAKEFKFVQQLQSTLDHAGLAGKVEVRVYPDDFPLAAAAHRYEEVPTELHALQGERNKSSSIDAKDKTDHWLTKNSKKRHNKHCSIYEKSKGRYCAPDEGIPAGCCGG